MERRLVGRMAAIVLVTLVMASDGGAQEKKDWPQHDEGRPQPPVVDPGPAADRPAAPPSDAIVLFDGKDLVAVAHLEGRQPRGLEGRGRLHGGGQGRGRHPHRVRRFGDCQLHVEWATPAPPSRATGQGRGNSGVFLMGQYEVQVLDSYRERDLLRRPGRLDLQAVSRRW